MIFFYPVVRPIGYYQSMRINQSINQSLKPTPTQPYLSCHVLSTSVTHLCLEAYLFFVSLRRVLNLDELTLRFVDELDLYTLGLERVRLLLSLGRQNSFPGAQPRTTKKKATTEYVITGRGEMRWLL